MPQPVTLKSWSRMVLRRPTKPFRTNTPKGCPFHYRGLECKSRKSRNTWSNRKIWPWNAEWSRAKTNRFCQENALVIANTLFQQHKRRLYTWTSPDGQHQNQTDYILCSQRWTSSTQSAKTRPGADCGSHHELIAKFRMKLKKVGKTTRPFRYDLYQILYDYTVEVTKRYKGLDMIDSAWRTMDRGSWHCTRGRDQDHPQEKEMKKGKMVVWQGLTNSWEKKRSKRQRRRGKIYPFECRVPKNRKES